jgi:hypothetical protein
MSMGSGAFPRRSALQTEAPVPSMGPTPLRRSLTSRLAVGLLSPPSSGRSAAPRLAAAGSRVAVARGAPGVSGRLRVRAVKAATVAEHARTATANSGAWLPVQPPCPPRRCWPEEVPSPACQCLAVLTSPCWGSIARRSAAECASGRPRFPGRPRGRQCPGRARQAGAALPREALVRRRYGPGPQAPPGFQAGHTRRRADGESYRFPPGHAR